MPSIIEPDVSGDVKLTWDPENPKEVEHAKRHFDELKKKGHIFFRVAPDGQKGKKVAEFGGDGQLICEFDPAADVVATQVPVGG